MLKNINKKSIWFLNITQNYQIDSINQFFKNEFYDVTVFGDSEPDTILNLYKKIKYRNLYIESRAKELTIDYKNLPLFISELVNYAYKFYYNFDLMCENFQINDGEFSSINRHELFIMLLYKYSAELNCKRVKLVYCSDVPHNIYDYIIYIICSYCKIDFYILRPLHTNYAILLKNGMGVESAVPIKIESPIKIKSIFEVDVSYMDGQYKALKRSFLIQNIIILFNGLKNIIAFNRINFYSKNFNLSNTLKILPGKASDTSLNLPRKIFLKIKSNVSKYLHRKRYNKYSDANLDFKKPLVSIFLNYQPEATTMPLADINADQLNMIIKVRALFSDGSINIYLKEHPSQFLTTFHSDTCRSQRFYDIIHQNNINMIHSDYPADKIIEKSDFIIVSNGTIGIQALLKGKRVIYFGDVWYKNYPNVIDGNINIGDLKILISKEPAMLTEVNNFHEKNILKLIVGHYHIKIPDELIKNYQKSFDEILDFIEKIVQSEKLINKIVVV